MCTDTARTTPVSDSWRSATVNRQVPSPGRPWKAESGSAGPQLPVNGAARLDTFRIGRSAESANTVSQKLFPLPPVRSNSVTVLPSGPCSVPTRSPTNVCCRPTVELTLSAEHLLPSMEKVTALTGPTPSTVIGTVTPAGLASGIASSSPLYRKVATDVEGSPTGRELWADCGENPPVNLTRTDRDNSEPRGA